MFNEQVLNQLKDEFPDLDIDRIRAVVQAKIDRGEEVKRPSGLVAYIAKNDGPKYRKDAPPTTAEVADHSADVHRYAMARCELYTLLAQLGADESLPEPHEWANEIEARAKQHPFATAKEEARILRQWGRSWPFQRESMPGENKQPQEVAVATGGEDDNLGF